jgi:hypothetical protein
MSTVLDFPAISDPVPALAAAPHVDTYLPASAPAVTYEAPVEPEPLFMSLDEINASIGDGFSMSAAFIGAVLDVRPTAIDAGYSLYNPVQYGAILRALAKHCEALA